MTYDRSTKRPLIFVCVAVVPVLILFGLLAFTHQLGAVSARVDGEKVHYVELDRVETDRRISQCVKSASASAVATCVEQAVQNSRELQRGEHELVVQRQASDWAFWALVVGLTQLPVSALGLVGLFLTIREGQKANAISHEYDRAWLRIDESRLQNVSYDLEGRMTAFLEIEVSNLGNSPATGVTAHACLWQMPIQGIAKLGGYLADARRGLQKRGPQLSGATTVIFPSEDGRKITLQTWPERDNLLSFADPLRKSGGSLITTWGCIAVFYHIQSGQQKVTLVPFHIGLGPDTPTPKEVLLDPVGKRAATGMTLHRPTAFDIAE